MLELNRALDDFSSSAGVAMQLPVLKRVAWLLAAVVSTVLGSVGHGARGVGGKLEIKVVDYDTGQPLACRIHLTNQAGKVQKPPKVPFWHDHFVVDGSLTLKLPNGNFNFVAERGPEYLVVTGHFEILDFAEDSKTITLRRFVDMSKEGWWSGDLEVERPKKEIELLMRGDDLHVAELVTWGNLKDLTKSGTAGKSTAAAADASPPGAGPLVLFGDDRCYHSQAGLLAGPEGACWCWGSLGRRPRPRSQATRPRS